MALIGINAYFVESLGNPMCIDDGAGHYLAFIALSCALSNVEASTRDDNVHRTIKFEIDVHWVHRIYLNVNNGS